MKQEATAGAEGVKRNRTEDDEFLPGTLNLSQLRWNPNRNPESARSGERPRLHTTRPGCRPSAQVEMSKLLISPRNSAAIRTTPQQKTATRERAFQPKRSSEKPTDQECRRQPGASAARWTG
ncbi:predicted protein [Chaetomium globosum CBS 148.51]|uniref:Uncharacterized protein n=1 Tax=Chaetomium globosum (strain ATCC 6205 / CBS 148.51 / DSM 1962 / NBRC 6347 / NRRL 1970) TaxID=306901 RepID=Q2H7M1_CHAGB|nr:uncharacterized protein CHGG_05344 [Chaetomium globosum CBS 148.51]EAQ88725.1 predicted protein [Chaetomium globosum CBS 148.51]